MASTLTDRQLLLLDNLIYLKWEGMKEKISGNPRISDIVSYFKNNKEFWEENTILKDRVLIRGGEKITIKEKSYPGGMDQNEWVEMIGFIENDATLMNLNIDYVEDATEDEINKNSNLASNIKIFPGNRFMVLSEGIKGSKKNPVVIFRGTNGKKEWQDDAEGGYMTDSPDQKIALTYINRLGMEGYKNITVSGHSKGGNKSEYLALMSDNVVRAVSYDGQGFSHEFYEKYREKINQNLGKVVKYAHVNDYVNPILFAECKVNFINGRTVTNPFYYHAPNKIFDNNGNLFPFTDRSKYSILISDLTQYANTELFDAERKATMYAAMKYFSKNQDAEYKDLENIFKTSEYEFINKKFRFGEFQLGNDENNVLKGKDIIIKPGYYNNEIDVIYGGSGNDNVYGYRGDDYLYGEDGNDNIYGGKGKDYIDGGKGTDYLYGEDDDDIYYFRNGYGKESLCL